MKQQNFINSKWFGVLCLGAALSLSFMISVDGDDVKADADRKEFVYDLGERRAVLRNLAGEVELFASSSNQLRIVANIVSDKTKFGGQNPIIFEIDDGRGDLVINTKYPLDDYDAIIYRPDGRKYRSNTTTRYLGERVKVTSRSVSGGARVHVDYQVYVPSGATFRLINAVGNISVNDVNGDFDLDASTGNISVNNTQGDIELDTGSGGLRVSNHIGDVSADTGSGGVSVADVSGNVMVDTGSGSVKINGAQGSVQVDTGSGSIDIVGAYGGVEIDTGSGGVDIETVTGDLLVDTGSGSIVVKDWSDGSRLALDTGSGKVQVAGDFSRVQNMDIDTGSGSVKLVSTTQPSMRLVVSANSGINIDVPEMSDVKSSRSRFRGKLGEGAGKGVIDTGAGSVSFVYQ